MIVECMCRNDKTLLHYKLELNLWEKIVEPKFEHNSVGRLAITLTKKDKKKWPALIVD